MNNLKFAMIALIGAGMIGCSPDDDGGGPSTPAPTGTMTGTIQVIGQNNDPAPWSATSVTATYDTLSGDLIIRAMGGGGNALKIHLSDTAVGNYTLGSLTSNFSEFYVNTSAFPFTTKRNDANANSLLVNIDGNNGSTISGSSSTIAWYEVNPEFSDDAVKVVLQEVVFEDVPVTYMNLFFEANNTMTAAVDGEQFSSTLVSVSHNSPQFTVAGTSSGSTLFLMLSDTIASGTTYDLGGMFSAFTAQYSTMGGNLNFSNSGEVTISTLDRWNGTMSGTFEFTTDNEMSISNGAFSVEYE